MAYQKHCPQIREPTLSGTRELYGDRDQKAKVQMQWNTKQLNPYSRSSILVKGRLTRPLPHLSGCSGSDLELAKVNTAP